MHQPPNADAWSEPNDVRRLVVAKPTKAVRMRNLRNNRAMCAQCEAWWEKHSLYVQSAIFNRSPWCESWR